MDRKKIGIALGLVLLITLFVFLKPAPEEEVSREFELTITDKKLVPDTINVNEGDNATIKINSDEKWLIHLHGYDLEKEVNPGEVSILFFQADIAGAFDIELHKPESHEHDEEVEVEQEMGEEGANTEEHEHTESSDMEPEEDIIIGILQVNPRL